MQHLTWLVSISRPSSMISNRCHISPTNSVISAKLKCKPGCHCSTGQHSFWPMLHAPCSNRQLQPQDYQIKYKLACHSLPTNTTAGHSHSYYWSHLHCYMQAALVSVPRCHTAGFIIIIDSIVIAWAKAPKTPTIPGNHPPCWTRGLSCSKSLASMRGPWINLNSVHQPTPQAMKQVPGSGAQPH